MDKDSGVADACIDQDISLVLGVCSFHQQSSDRSYHDTGPDAHRISAPSVDCKFGRKGTNADGIEIKVGSHHFIPHSMHECFQWPCLA